MCWVSCTYVYLLPSLWTLTSLVTYLKVEGRTSDALCLVPAPISADVNQLDGIYDVVYLVNKSKKKHFNQMVGMARSQCHKQIVAWAVVEGQLAERSFPIPEVRSSHPVIVKIL